MSLYVPPENIVDLVDIKDGRFVIDKKATPEQIIEFEKWRDKIEVEKREFESEFI